MFLLSCGGAMLALAPTLLSYIFQVAASPERFDFCVDTSYSP